MHTMVADGASTTFENFMEWALYNPDTGYYRQAPEKLLGKRGDFYTASQLQPAFGALIATLLSQEAVLELGAGREEMRHALAPRTYRAVGLNDRLPAEWRGSIFANEFFDALPVTAGIRQGNQLRELWVQRQGSTYRWEIGPDLCTRRQGYVRAYYPDLPDGARFEIAERAIDWIRRISECLVSGTVLIIDYGWSANEYLRFPEGTLMSYRRHVPATDVLAHPCQQDITSHVPFPVLIDAARQHGFTVARFETLSQTLVGALERAPNFLEAARHRPQLKTLLFGMGESFRTLLLQRDATK